MEQTHSWKVSSHSVKKRLAFCGELEGSLVYFNQPATGHYPESVSTSPDTYTLFLLDNFYYLALTTQLFILWHADLLLGNDHEISNYTTAVDK
jgi:hypothetical protein